MIQLQFKLTAMLYNQRAIETEIKLTVYYVFKFTWSTQNRRYINSLYSLYKDVCKTLNVGGTFRNVATLFS